MSSQLIPLDINSLSFDSFARNPQRDVVCLAPIRTIIRREEEIVLVRKVRKVEEIDAGLSCPATTVPLSANPQPQPTVQTTEADYQPFQWIEPTEEDSTTQTTAPSATTAISEEELVVHGKSNCYYIDPTDMNRLQQETSVSKLLQPGTYTISLSQGTFDYCTASGHPGEPLVLLWLYGGRVINHKTGVAVGATWSTLNGYGDQITVEVIEPATLCAFFFDTYLEDNEGEVTVTVSGTDSTNELVVHSQRNCYYIDPESMKRLENTAVSKMLPVGRYAIQLKEGAFSYRNGTGHEGEPLLLLWIYGGKVMNRKTGVEVGATWSSLNGYGDTLMLDVLEPATLCAFFYDTYLEDNAGEVKLSLAQVG